MYHIAAPLSVSLYHGGLRLSPSAPGRRPGAQRLDARGGLPHAARWMSGHGGQRPPGAAAAPATTPAAGGQQSPPRRGPAPTGHRPPPDPAARPHGGRRGHGAPQAGTQGPRQGHQHSAHRSHGPASGHQTPQARPQPEGGRTQPPTPEPRAARQPGAGAGSGRDSQGRHERQQRHHQATTPEQPGAEAQTCRRPQPHGAPVARRAGAAKGPRYRRSPGDLTRAGATATRSGPGAPPRQGAADPDGARPRLPAPRRARSAQQLPRRRRHGGHQAGPERQRLAAAADTRGAPPSVAAQPRGGAAFRAASLFSLSASAAASRAATVQA